MLMVLLLPQMFFSGCGNNKGTEDKKTFSEFVLLVEKKLQDSESSNLKLDKNNCIEYIRIYNTINYYDLNKGPLFSKFTYLFENTLLARIIGVLECGSSMGYGHYCESVDLYIGGSLKFAENSYFEITGEYFEYVKNGYELPQK